jgi:NCAIR mutase (PurE)-related protein
METEHLRDLLQRVRTGELDTEAALERLRRLPFEDLGYAKVDTHRAVRRDFPEVVYGPGKTPEQIAAVLRRLAAAGSRALATRVDAHAAETVQALFPDATWQAGARMLTVGEPPPETAPGFVAVLSAGTSDLPVAEEAALTARWTGSRVERLYDVGVAGIHRLLAHQERLFEARVLVVVAGMDGVLPSVVGGLVRAPVVAVPTSVGYGAGSGGIAPLLTMLNACSPGVAVVNIDNGFGAGYLAGVINRLGTEGAP